MDKFKRKLLKKSQQVEIKKVPNKPNIEKATIQPIRNSLTDIANKYGTDKGNLHYEAHNYTKIYELLLSGLPPDLKLLEIGVYEKNFPGASSMMWREFLPKARLFGIDINPEAKKLESDIEIAVYIADQGDSRTQHQIMDQIGKVDLVIDDGSHRMEHIANSLITIWPFLEDNGYYVIEDLHVHDDRSIFVLRNLADSLQASISNLSTRKLMILEKVI